MEQDQWVPTAPESAVAEGTIGVLTPKGVSIVVIRKDGRLFALRNRCAHMSCTLAGGHLEGTTLRCPCHGWTFDVTNGQFINAREIAIPTYPCKVEDGRIFVKLEGS